MERVPVNDMMMNRFVKANGSYICNDLLGYDVSTPEGAKKAREEGLFTDFCPRMVASAVDILEEITVKINWSWSRGASRFTSIDKEELIHVNYVQPWISDTEHPFGLGGPIYWFGKRKIIGYPYSPHLVQGRCYRLRVRRCTTRQRFYLLEDVIDCNVDVSSDEGIYKSCYEKLMNRFDADAKEVLIYCAKDVVVSKQKRADGMPIGYAYVDFSAIIDEDGGSPKMVRRCLTIPFDDRKFAENKTLKFRAGNVR